MTESQGNRPRISVIVRAHNDEALIGRTLAGVFSQHPPPSEVIVCDDNSTDRTREVASRFPVRFVERPAGPYKPGRTLNMLVRESKGDIVVFNNSDAIPLDSKWLEELVKPLLSGTPRVFAFANQLPRPDAQALVRKDNERAFGDGKVQATWKFFFSLASSATWRQNLLDVPFDEQIQYSEDVEWAWRNSRRKEDPVKIVYCPASRVEHSHNYTLRELAKRFRGEGAADRAIFGESPSLVREIVGAARETLRDWAYLLRRPRDWAEIPSAPIRRLVQRIEIFAERHVARLRAEGHEVDVASDIRQEMGRYDEIVVHKCSDVATLERFPPEKTVYYVHDHEPICPRSYAYTPLKRNCTRPGGVWPCIFCAPLCRNWKSALKRVLSQERRKRAMARFRRLVVISEFMKGRLVANGIPAEKIVVEPPVLDILNAEARNRRASGARVCSEPSRAQASAERRRGAYVGTMHFDAEAGCRP